MRSIQQTIRIVFATIIMFSLCVFASQAEIITNTLHADSGYVDSTGAKAAAFTYAGSVSPTSTVRSAIFIFELPTLSAGESISAARLEVYLEQNNVEVVNGDVYAVRVSDDLDKLTSDYYTGANDTSSGVSKITDNLVTASSALGSYDTGDSNTLGTWLAGHYTGVNPDSTYAFLRISVDASPSGTYNMFRFSETGDANPAVLEITTTGDGGGNQPPVAYDVYTSMIEDTQKSIILDASDPDDDPLSYSYTQPSNGTVTGPGPDVTYTPDTGYTGSDTFMFTVDDGHDHTASATVYITVNAFSAVGEWRQMPIRGVEELSLGRYGGEGEQLFHGLARSKSDPDVIYLNQDVHGIWRSPDGGVTWDKTMDRGLHCVNGWSIAVDPVNPDIVLAFQDMDNTWYEFADKYKGLYRSVNGGEDWERVLDVAGNIEWTFDRKLKHNIAYDPASVDGAGATRWYLAVQSGEYTQDYYQNDTNTPIWTYGGIYRSEDHGQTWTAQNTSMQGHIRIEGIVPHPTDGQTLYLASDQGLSISTDQGVSFSPLGDIPADYWVSSVAVHPTDPDHIYAYAYTNQFNREETPGVYRPGVWHKTYGMGLYESVDGGEHFSLLPETSNAIAVFMNEGNPDILYLNRYGSPPRISLDGGSNWTEITVNDDIWIEDRNRRPMFYQSGFAASSTDSNNVVAVGAGSIHRSTDGGLTFDHSRTKFTGFAQGFYGGGFLFDTFDPNRFAICLSDVTMIQTETGARFFELLNGNGEIQAWEDAGLVPWYGAGSGSFQPVEGSGIIVASVGYIGQFYLMRSDNNGASWTLYEETPEPPDTYKSLSRDYSFIGFDPDNPETVYAGDKVSFDAGISWQSLPTVGAGKEDRVNVVGMCDSSAGTVVFGISEYGKRLWRSSDPLNEGWELFFDGSGFAPQWKLFGVDASLPVVAVHPSDPDIIAVLGPPDNRDAVIITRDGTANEYHYTGLIDQSGGAADGNWAHAVVFDPRHPEVMYASCGVPGLPNTFRSVDSGTNWTCIDFNRSLTGARTLAVSPYSGELFSGSTIGTWVLPPPYADPGGTPISDKLVYFGPECTSTNPPSAPAGLDGNGLSESTVNVTWEESVHEDCGVMYYGIARDGEAVGTSYTLSYTDTGLNELTSYEYTVSAMSLGWVQSPWSTPKLLSTTVDTVRPVIDWVPDTVYTNQVRVEFSEALEAASAENTANYAIDGGVSILSAVLDGNVVILTTSAMGGGTRTLTVNNVKDASSMNNVIEANSQATFRNLAGSYPDDPMAWWPFDGSTNDVIGANHGEWMEGAPAYTSGWLGQAIALDGTSDGPYVRVPDDASLEGMSTLSISVWAKKDNSAVGGQLFKKHVTYDLEINASAHDFDGYVRNNLNEAADLHGTTVTNIQNTAWHHYAVVYDGTNAMGYVDGVEVASVALSGAVQETSHDLYIGKDPWGLAFAGAIDEMKIFTRALGTDEVEALAAEREYYVPAPPPSPDQLLNLPDSPTNRFEITDRIWPATPGETDICLWKDDKLAAVTITIDDNSATDINWWLEQEAIYDWKFTWFIITERPDTDSYLWGTWNGNPDPNYDMPSWNELYNMGHDIQSHTVTHLHAGEPDHDPRVETIDDEYRLAIDDIELNIPGRQCTMLAYPGNSNPSVTNDSAVAALYYSGARGLDAHINKINQTTYLMTCTPGNDGIKTNETSWNSITLMFDGSSAYYRGWYTVLFHGVSDKVEATNDFTWVKDREDDLWVGTYSDVSRYGQERDSATLTVTENTATQIRFTLSDRMLDTVFTMPLTVKVRIPNDWTAMTATQDEGLISGEIVDYEGNLYALVQAVPDQGEIKLLKQ